MSATQKQAKVNREADAIHDRVMKSSSGSYGFWNSNVETAVAKQLLLKGSFMSEGSMWRYQAKSLGCGVQKITIIQV